MKLIQARDLTVRYGSDVLALDKISFELEPGIIGLVGANGAGKSTLIKGLLGLIRPTSGTVRVFGADPVADREEVRSRLGYMPEHDCLPPDVTAVELVSHFGRLSGLPPAAARERASETLRHVGLHEERFRPVGGYSTGMRQRAKLAQALVHDPTLLLLDEPTNGLDPAGREAMLELVGRVGAEFGISILVCSHLLGEVERICDSLVAIDAGRLLRADRVSSMTGETGVLAVEIDDGEVADGLDRLAASLVALEPRREGSMLLIPLTGPDTYDLVLRAVVQLELPLRRLDARRHRIAEVFAGEAVG